MCVVRLMTEFDPKPNLLLSHEWLLTKAISDYSELDASMVSSTSLARQLYVELDGAQLGG